jgi:hypothetical protein
MCLSWGIRVIRSTHKYMQSHSGAPGIVEAISGQLVSRRLSEWSCRRIWYRNSSRPHRHSDSGIRSPSRIPDRLQRRGWCSISRSDLRNGGCRRRHISGLVSHAVRIYPARCKRTGIDCHRGVVAVSWKKGLGPRRQISISCRELSANLRNDSRIDHPQPSYRHLFHNFDPGDGSRFFSIFSERGPIRVRCVLGIFVLAESHSSNRRYSTQTSSREGASSHIRDRQFRDHRIGCRDTAGTPYLE